MAFEGRGNPFRRLASSAEASSLELNGNVEVGGDGDYIWSISKPVQVELNDNVKVGVEVGGDFASQIAAGATNILGLLICVYLLQITYAVAMLTGFFSSSLSSRLITVLGLFALASILWTQAKSIDLKSK